MRREGLIGAVALAMTVFVMAPGVDAKEDEMVQLTGCVQGFAQGGYFFSDVVTEKGKVKHYLLVNNNEEVKQFEGKTVKVEGTPAPFGWSVKFTTSDNRTLKTSSVFGVDTVEVIHPTCEIPTQSASR